MRLPLRLSTHLASTRWVAAAVLAVIATGVATMLRMMPVASGPMTLLDDTLYDAFYRTRAAEDRTNGNVVIISVDDASLANLARNHKYWPWPRDYWALLVEYLQKCGARAVTFDLLFSEPSPLTQFMDDDAHFGAALDSAGVPVVMGTLATAQGKAGPFAIPTKKTAAFGAVNILTDKVVREYPPDVNGLPSLATRVVREVGAPPPNWASEPFRLHYYGPYRRRDGGYTYRYFSAAYVFADAQAARKKSLNAPVIDPAMFRGKIVLVGATSAGTYDLKSSPISQLYPGVEVQATAIDNLLEGKRVIPIGGVAGIAICLVASLLGALGVTLPRKVSLKLIGALGSAVLLIAWTGWMFDGTQIRWVALSSPLIALLLSTIGAFAWTYLVEEKQRRLVLKALSQYVSPAVAAELGKDPSKLKLGGERREMTVMFTDIQGFTGLSEMMPPEQLSTMLNYYLGEMAALILETDGTIDKYIGDAIMSFWNAPLRVNDHAARACTAALKMKRREEEIQPTLRELGAPGLLTRIGINTGPMVFGNMGSAQKFNYTVLGDSVNLGSRLEGANKFYGSRILLAQATAELVKNRFQLRELDLLQVKGKQQPMAVYELLAEDRSDEVLRALVAAYEQGLALYREQKWDEAQQVLEAARERWAEDGPVNALLTRIEKLRHDPPPADWNGVYVAKDK